MALLAAKDKGEKKLFGFSFSPLMRDDGTTLSDDIHELYVYKVWTWLSSVSIPQSSLLILKYNVISVVFIGHAGGFNMAHWWGTVRQLWSGFPCLIHWSFSHN